MIARVRGSHLLAVTAAACLVLSIWEVSAVRRSDPFTTDGSYYQGLADNLAAHRGYVFDFKPHTRYPPGFPVMLAVAGGVVGHDYSAYVKLMPLFGVAGLLAMLFVVAREDQPWVAAAGCVLLASSPQFFRSATGDVLSDLPYFAASGGVLLAADRDRPHVLWSSLLLAAAVAIRSAGIALVAAVLATLVWNWRSLPPRGRLALGIIAAAGIVAEGAWLAWVLTHASPDWPGDAMDSYLRQLALKNPREPGLGAASAVDVLWRARDGLSTLAARSSEVAARLPWAAPLWFSPLVLVPIAFVGMGIVESLAHRRSVLLAWYVAAYCALYALWPFDEGARFVLPIFPLLVMFGVRGAIVFLRVVKSRRAASIIPAALAFLAAAALWSAWRDPAPGIQERVSVATLFVLAAGAVVLVRVRTEPRVAFVNRHMPATVAIAVVLTTGAGFFEQAVIASTNRASRSEPTEKSSAVSLAAWLNARPDVAPVMAQQTAVFHRLTGRRMVAFPTVEDGNLVSTTMRTHDVAFIIVANDETAQYYRPSERARFEALRAAAPGCCELAYLNNGYRLYRVSARASLTQVRSVLRQSCWKCP